MDQMHVYFGKSISSSRQKRFDFIITHLPQRTWRPFFSSCKGNRIFTESMKTEKLQKVYNWRSEYKHPPPRAKNEPNSPRLLQIVYKARRLLRISILTLGKHWRFFENKFFPHNVIVCDTYQEWAIGQAAPWFG